MREREREREREGKRGGSYDAFIKGVYQRDLVDLLERDIAGY